MTGESVEKLKNSLSDAVLAQYIASPSEGATVNLVNAAAFAKNQGIQVCTVCLGSVHQQLHDIQELIMGSWDEIANVNFFYDDTLQSYTHFKI